VVQKRLMFRHLTHQAHGLSQLDLVPSPVFIFKPGAPVVLVEKAATTPMLVVRVEAGIAKGGLNYLHLGLPKLQRLALGGHQEHQTAQAEIQEAPLL
jgi:hypothetical protein